MRRRGWQVLGSLGIICLALGWAGGRSVPAAGEAELTEEPSYVALTFDDGPRRGTTDRLLDGLRQRGASATFFLIGSGIAGKEDLVKRMEAEGHQVGNHTWSHVRLQGADPATISKELQATDTLLKDLLGEGSYWLRPPYGLMTPGTEQAIPVPMVKWSVDPRDWESRNTEQVVRSVLSSVKPNSIILLHDIYETSVEAALQIVDTLQQEGYQFVTVQELLAINGVTPEPGVLYSRGTA
nr:polysaccharide deacetylase family protein [uncultured Dysosmobacter sp.]